MGKAIGIVILNYKTYIDTENLVNNILSQNSCYKIYIQIVDNASPNESYEYLQAKFADMANVDVFYNPINSGFARGNNVGLRLLKDKEVEYALILNNDIRFDLKVLEELEDVYNRIPNVGIVSPLQRLPNNELETFDSLKCESFLYDISAYTYFLRRFLRKKWEYIENTDYSQVQKVDIVPGCFLFIDYALFESVGFFDESTFLFWEEHFLFKKMEAIGKDNYIALNCDYIHDHSKTINQEYVAIGQLKLHHEGLVLFTKKYRRHPRTKCLLLYVFFYLCIFRLKIKQLIKK